MSFTHAIGTNRYGEADLIVSTNAANGTHVTLASAMSAATSGQTIFLRDSVTENVTITPGVNIASWDGGTLNTPSITGTLTMTGAGTSTISGIRLVTNSAAVIAVTGSAASILNLDNCYLSCTNNTGITFSTSSASAQINIFNSAGDLGTTGIAYFSHSSAGTLNFHNCYMTNSGVSVTASTCSAGTTLLKHTFFANPITSSGTAVLSSAFCSYSAFGNTTALTMGGSGAQSTTFDGYSTGTAAAISIGSTAAVTSCQIGSSNANAITGAGTINLTDCTFTNSTTINTTTQTPAYFKYGIAQSSTQPAFLAYLASSALNKTGNAASYTLGTDALTEVFDQNSNFVTSGTFTAPVTGRYQFTGYTLLVGCTIASLLGCTLVTSNRSYLFQVGRTAAATNFGCPISVLVDMDAADTQTLAIVATGEAGDTDDIYGAATPGTFISAKLEC